MKMVMPTDPPINQAPPDLDPSRDLPRGFSEFLLPLHRAFSPRQQELANRRRHVLAEAHRGHLPAYLPPSEATTGSWKVAVPGWCEDQRNKMTESADEALWWRDLFRAIAQARGWPQDYIKCMALVESHPIAYQMEEFAYNLREHMMGLNLGRWDYMASLIDFTLADPNWVLPDRNTIPHDVAFFQSVREVMPEVCHKPGMLAIGGMTALYPSRADAELNARALNVLEQDKKNEANSLMDGAWTGHPDQNEIAVNQFPYPNQLQARRKDADIHKDLRPSPQGVGKRTLQDTRDAIRTVIRYRNGVLNGKGASLLDGYMEDLATDRIYRYMIAQRTLHRVSVPDANGRHVPHPPDLVTQLFDEELDRLRRESSTNGDAAAAETYRKARDQGEGMVLGVLEAQGVQIR